MSDTLYIEINLNDIIKGIGEISTKEILSDFSCPKNKDIENFLKFKAIEFSKRNFAKTHLVFWYDSVSNSKELAGYYTIAQKTFNISKGDVSNSQYKKISPYGQYDSTLKKCTIPAILIGQLGKNYANGNDILISGDELLNLALEKVKFIQNEVGGKYTYLECEDKQKLLNFYLSNGFIPFGKRNLDKDETDIDGSYLIQLIRKID